MKNRISLSIGLFFCILLATSFLEAAEQCIGCHEEGNGPRIDKIQYRASVHGNFPCTACHTGITSYPHPPARQVDCGVCHSSGAEGAPVVQAQQYAMSVHAAAAREGSGPGCATCHGSHDILPSRDPRSRTNRFHIPGLCSSCHPAQYALYRPSIHGTELLDRKNASAATCFDCHLEHRIPRVSEPGWMLSLINECGTCHAKQMETYRMTYHGKITRLGYTTVAKCVDCHGSHAILPPASAASTLSPDHIVATCGRCHPGATASFTKFYAHPDESDRTRYPVLYYTYRFMTALLIAVFAFFLTHTLLWLFRSLKERRKENNKS